MKSWTIENLSTTDINNNHHQNFGILTKEGRIALLGENQEANARLIVNAVNCRDELVEALKKTLNWINSLNEDLEDNDPLKIMQEKYHAPYKKIIKEALAKSESI